MSWRAEDAATEVSSRDIPWGCQLAEGPAWSTLAPLCARAGPSRERGVWPRAPTGVPRRVLKYPTHHLVARLPDHPCSPASCQEVTRLIQLNVALNFLHGRPSAAQVPRPLPPEPSGPRAPWNTVPSPREASAREPRTANGAGRGRAGQGLPVGEGGCGSAARAGCASRGKAPVVALPLVWGQGSEEVRAFAPEVIVMSDVVYDPAGEFPRSAAVSRSS